MGSLPCAVTSLQILYSKKKQKYYPNHDAMKTSTAKADASEANMI
jgi:hypothetical protein